MKSEICCWLQDTLGGGRQKEGRLECKIGGKSLEDALSFDPGTNCLSGVHEQHGIFHHQLKNDSPSYAVPVSSKVLRCTDRNLELWRNINETISLRQSGDCRQSLEFCTAQCKLGYQSVNPEALRASKTTTVSWKKIHLCSSCVWVGKKKQNSLP